MSWICIKIFAILVSHVIILKAEINYTETQPEPVESTTMIPATQQAPSVSNEAVSDPPPTPMITADETINSTPDNTTDAMNTTIGLITLQTLGKAHDYEVCDGDAGEGEEGCEDKDYPYCCLKEGSFPPTYFCIEVDCDIYAWNITTKTTVSHKNLTLTTKPTTKKTNTTTKHKG